MEIEDIEVFEILNNPTRFRILARLYEPKSIREVAEEMGVPPTRLYYHVNLLEEAGILRVVETRKVGAMLQKIYQTAAKSFRPALNISRKDHEPHDVARAAAGIVLDGARADVEEALTEHFSALREGAEDTDMIGSLGRSLSFMTEERANEFKAKLQKLIEEDFDPDVEEGSIEYSFTYAFFPLAGAREQGED